MTVDRLDQSRRLTAAVRALRVEPAGGSVLARWAPGYDVVHGKPRGRWEVGAPLGWLETEIIDLRDPLTRAGVPLLVAQAAGVERVWVESMGWTDEVEGRTRWWCVYEDKPSGRDVAGPEDTPMFEHPDPVEALLLYLEWLAATTATTAPGASPVADGDEPAEVVATTATKGGPT